MQFRIGFILLIAALSSLPAAAQEAFPHGRLPDTVTPERYTLDLRDRPAPIRLLGPG